MELLKDYTTVSGSLVMNGKHIKNLEGIENVSSIGGSLCIEYNDALTSLSGLQNITSVPGYLSIGGNADLKSLSGLENITSVGKTLKIESNDGLTSLSGLDGLASVGSLYIWGNPALTSLSVFQNITSVQSLDIGYNDALTALGMTGLQRVGDDFSIVSNSSLCGSLAEDLRDQVLAGGGIGGTRTISGNKECTTP
jgi:hypothetical protein